MNSWNNRRNFPHRGDRGNEAENFVAGLVRYAEAYVGGDAKALSNISSQVKSKANDINKGKGKYKLSSTKAVVFVEKANKLYDMLDKGKGLKDSLVLLEAAKLSYIGRKKKGEGSVWFDVASNLLEKVAEVDNEEAKKRYLEVLKLISTYLAAYSKT